MSGANPGALRSAQVRRAHADEGRAFAQAYAARRRPVAAADPYLFHGHRRCSDWTAPHDAPVDLGIFAAGIPQNRSSHHRIIGDD